MPRGPGAPTEEEILGSRRDRPLVRLSECASTALLALAASAGSLPAQTFTERVVDSPTAPWALFAIDLDRDGDVDVISGDGGGVTAQATLYWYENDGGSPPTFTRHPISSGRDVSSIHAVDLDADDDVDIVVGTSAQGQVNWFENDGAPFPGFTRHLIDGSASFNRDVHAADIDGDGNLDVLAAASGAFRFTVYRSDGGTPPTFLPWRDWPSSFPVAIRGVDLDLDGDTDVVLADHLRSGAIVWQENVQDVAPGFVEHPIAAGVERPHQVFPIDIDRDGDVDVLAASTDDNTIAWYENDGLLPPSFAQRIISSNALQARSVYAADVDGDGDPDVLSASESDQKVAWYESDGAIPPAFEERPVSTTADGAREVLAIDLDGDGDTDVLSVSRRDDTLAWYEHRFGLETSGGCGGVVNVEVTGAPPSSEVAIVAAPSRSGFVKGGALCNGAEFEIGGALQLPPVFVLTNEAGYGTAVMDVRAGSCWLEALAFATCETTGAVALE